MCRLIHLVTASRRRRGSRDIHSMQPRPIQAVDQRARALFACGEHRWVSTDNRLMVRGTAAGRGVPGAAAHVPASIRSPAA